MRISKEFRFEAAHQLPADKECTYGVCERLHGHSYRIVIEVEGAVNQFGWILNFKDVGAIVNSIIIEPCDHRFLNDLFPNMPTTAENMALIWGARIHRQLKEKFLGCKLSKIEVWETAKCAAIANTEDVESSLA